VQDFDFSRLSELSDLFSANRPIDRLAAALWVNRSFPEVGRMALFTAYFDASGEGQENQPLVIVSGFVANFQQWGMFQSLWERAHREAGAELPFHMVDFMAACNNPHYAQQKNARADYVRLAGNPQEAKKFLHHLALSEVTALSCGISCMVPMKLYNEVNSVLYLRELLPPYALGARMCIEKLHQWEEKFEIEEPTEYIFESGDFEQGKFTSLMIDEGQNVPIYKSKNDFVGLQAADHYAWEQSYFIKKRQRDPNFVARDDLGLLIYGIPKLHVEPSLEKLIKLCEIKGIKQRGVKIPDTTLRSV